MIKGVSGQIKWYYHDAAEVTNYTVTRSKPPESRWSLRATVTRADEFKLAQRPLVFVAPHAHGEWRWPIETLECGGTSVTASLGPPLE